MRVRSDLVSDFLEALRKMEELESETSPVKIDMGNGSTLVLNLEATEERPVFYIVKTGND